MSLSRAQSSRPSDLKSIAIQALELEEQTAEPRDEASDIVTVHGDENVTSLKIPSLDKLKSAVERLKTCVKLLDIIEHINKKAKTRELRPMTVGEFIDLDDNEAVDDEEYEGDDEESKDANDFTESEDRYDGSDADDGYDDNDVEEDDDSAEEHAAHLYEIVDSGYKEAGEGDVHNKDGRDEDGPRRDEYDSWSDETGDEIVVKRPRLC